MIIIAVYVAVGHMPRAKAEEQLAEITDMLNYQKPDGVIYHILGTNNQETKMELIYPPSLNTDILVETMQKLK